MHRFLRSQGPEQPINGLEQHTEPFMTFGEIKGVLDKALADIEADRECLRSQAPEHLSGIDIQKEHKSELLRLKGRGEEYRLIAGHFRQIFDTISDDVEQ